MQIHRNYHKQLLLKGRYLFILLLVLAMVFHISTKSSARIDQSKFSSARRYFREKYFSKKVQNIQFETLTLSKERGEIAQDKSLQHSPPYQKKEDIYSLSLLITTNSSSKLVENCQISDRVFCGWMTLNCYGQGSTPQGLEELTQEKQTTLVYTYDSYKAKKCAEHDNVAHY